MTRVTRSVQEAAETLARGELVAIPTETVYGLAGNALDPVALARIFAAKERPSFDPLILHLAPASEAWRDGSLTDLSSFAPEARALLERLVARFWPGPLTIVLPKTPLVPDLATSGLPRVALRKPAHPLAQQLLDSCRFPLAAPSANRFGRVSPTEAAHVMSELGGRIPLVLDGGPCSVGVESTVIAVSPDAQVSVLRPGGVAPEEIEAVAGRPLLAEARPTDQAASPGTLESHYAPTTPISLIGDASGDPELRKLALGRKVALLTCTGIEPALLEKRIRGSTDGDPWLHRQLSPRGDWSEAARELFRALRELDASGRELILAELPPEPRTGLAHAIADRLKRAAAKRDSSAKPARSPLR